MNQGILYDEKKKAFCDEQDLKQKLCFKEFGCSKKIPKYDCMFKITVETTNVKIDQEFYHSKFASFIYF